MAINSKRKGKTGELELARKLKEYGYGDARRTAQYCGNTGDASDVVGLPGIHIECKRTENLRLYDAVDQAKRDSSGTGKLPVVFHRKNHCEWVAILPLDDFMTLYREYEADLTLKESANNE